MATEDAEVVGTITLSFNLATPNAGEYAQIEELILDESQRGKGTGAACDRLRVYRTRTTPCTRRVAADELPERMNEWGLRNNLLFW